jgi:tetratricopeptide (TPR) repeat protein
MSLLIKALDKAEKAQEEQQKVQNSGRRHAKNIATSETASLEAEKVELALEAPESNNSGKVFYQSLQDDAANASRAANVFEAKYAQPSSSFSPMMWVALSGLLALLVMAIYFYYQLNHIQAPEKRQNQPVLQASSSQQDLPRPPQATLPAENSPSTQIKEPVGLSQNEELVAPQTTTELKAKHDHEKKHLASAERGSFNTDDAKDSKTTSDRTDLGSTPVVKKSSLNFDEPIASESASIKISKSSKPKGVDPVLLDAYNAYITGNDQNAQALYKQVLQRDTHNIDALLGMGAIAERQGRERDALGWYQQVLVLEPRNPIALSAYYDREQDTANKELQLKNLIAKTPNNPNAHADLGDYYAEQNRWAEAQQSYFDAYRLNVSAENAYNLAVSLDQLGKSAVALPYYQQALALDDKKQHHLIDQAAVQARIAAIQVK